MSRHLAAVAPCAHAHSQLFEGKKDVILFAIDCSESMLELYDDPEYEDVQTCHLLVALNAAMQIQKRKVIVGPNDSVGIMLFNTVSRLFIPQGTHSNPIGRRPARTKSLVSIKGQRLRRTITCSSISRISMPPRYRS